MDEVLKKDPPPRREIDPRWKLGVQLAGFAMVAVAIYLGLRAQRPDAPPPAASATTTATETHPAAVPVGVASPPSPEVSGNGVRIDPPGAPNKRSEATRLAQEAMDAAHAELARDCAPKKGKASFTVRLIVDAKGSETQRSVRQDSGDPDADAVDCIVNHKTKLRIAPPGEDVGIVVTTKLP